MTTTLDALSDKTFVREFENLTLNPEYFDHQGHLRLAWLYLDSHTADNAIDKTCNGIQAYAESLGATDKFHRTITEALVRIMRKRMQANHSPSWQDFLNLNSDIKTDALTVLAGYYSHAVLFSEQAKTHMQAPDIKPF